MRVDDVGNMYARREGTTADALSVLIGSHPDTVMPGGRYDGIMGICIALETIALLNEAAVNTSRPIEVVNWTGEEGARFPPAMLGSGVVTGFWDAEYAHSRVDAEGLRLDDELRRIGFLGLPENRLGGFFVALEAHIEQGTRLEDADAHVGIVTAIDPVRWCTVTVTGPGGHAGGPGPIGRKDAMVAAARMVLAARDVSLTDGAFKTTVGRVVVLPGANNVIPHSVTFNVDVRSHDDAAVDHHLGRLRELFHEIADDEGVRVSSETVWKMAGTSFDAAVRDVLSRVAQRRGARWMEIRGTVGHDTLHLAARGPAAMVFIRTTAGLSHCEEEHAPWDAVLTAACLR
jgi:beta-ureidopropionase / N-carbamoyl-L-amino-acid hydrolase